MSRQLRNEIEFTVHPQPGYPTEFRLKGHVFSVMQFGDVKVQVELPAVRYQQLQEIFGAIDVWSWQGDFDDPDVTDGLCWKLRTKSNSRTKKAEGCNAYPPAGTGPEFSAEFDTLLNTFLELSEEISGKPLELGG